MNALAPLAIRSLASCPAADAPESPAEIPSRRIAHTLEEIVRELAHGHVPATDNVDALLRLGFVRDRPQDPLDVMWSRAVEGSDARDGSKRQIIQRVELFTSTTSMAN